MPSEERKGDGKAVRSGYACVCACASRVGSPSADCLCDAFADEGVQTVAVGQLLPEPRPESLDRDALIAEVHRLTREGRTIREIYAELEGK